MERREIGIRAQDIQTALQDVELSGPASGLLNTTVLTGMAERLSIHIRGIDIIDDERRLYALADRLGIGGLVLDSVLSLMEQAEFVSVERSQGKVKRVIERVPYFEDIYERFGEIWEARNPPDEEKENLRILNELASSPRLVEDVTGDFPIHVDQHRVLMEVGKEGGYFAEFLSPTDGSPIIYSPLYWEEKPEETFKLVKKYGSERIATAIRKVRAYQGMPIPELGPESTEDDQIIVEAMVAGLLPSPQVDSLKGPKRFAFTPYQGQVNLAATERPVLQKARAILSCVRYGQHFGTITRVKDPAAIIRALQLKGRIGPHSEVARQYAILVVEGVGRITRDATYSDRYYLQIVDTEENKKALSIAADILEIGEAITERGLNVAARSVLFRPGIMKEPLTTRSEELLRRKRDPKYSSESIKHDIEKLIDEVRQL